ncbi:MAG: heavy metal translocating P-type ATPase [Desulfobacterales bacterium]|nr:heavy metal translocating P-type ATPase [Desulfobacterales bacterium]
MLSWFFDKEESYRTGDIMVSYPEDGCLEIHGAPVFADLKNEMLINFVEKTINTKDINSVAIDSKKSLAKISYSLNGNNKKSLSEKFFQYLKKLTGKKNDDKEKLLGDEAKKKENNKSRIHSILLYYNSSSYTRVQFFRYGKAVSSWEIKHELPGRIRLKNPLIYRKKEICGAIENELMNTFGVCDYETNEITSTALVYYKESIINKYQIINLLDNVLDKVNNYGMFDDFDIDFSLCSITLGISSISQFIIPQLMPLSTLLYICSSIPSYQGAQKLIFDEKRVGVDILDAIILTCCLVTGQIFAGAIMCWCLGLGRKLLKKTQDDSRRVLLNAFGKQPHFAFVLRNGIEIEIPLDQIKYNDIVVVKTGEVVPVDGIISEGFAMIDQHALTGESVPAEKGVGETVFASTLLVAGRIMVAVEKAGSETAAAQITKILNATLEYKLTAQTRGEALADKAVIPTLSLSALAYSFMGPNGAMAVVNCDLGTGIRIAAPLGMLTCLNLCTQEGILVKDGRALEQMAKIDTILFDKTGTLTKERPEVGRVIWCGEYNDDQIIQMAATAEQRFSHPIAAAIREECDKRELPLLTTDESSYQVGFGITVVVEGKTVRVGSARFMKLEEIEIPDFIEAEMTHIFEEGHSLIMVALNKELAGAIELRSSQRPEIQEIINGLRKRGINHMAIISGDHERPTANLAEKLGMQRYFSEVLPQDKAKYVELLQSEGRIVCFVGDGINDAIALKKANASISLRGATSLATDTAQIVFMEESLQKLCTLVDISRMLENNIKRSWHLIVYPNSICIAGVFLMGFGLWHSVLFNNVTILLSLANGMLPLYKVLKAKANKEKQIEMMSVQCHQGKIEQKMNIIYE